MNQRQRMKPSCVSMRTNPSALGWMLVMVLLCSCVGTPTAWRQVDSERMMITVVGRLEALDMPAEGEVRLEVTPDPAHRFALAPGQQRLVCIVQAADRDSLTTQLLNLTVGHMVSVSGYWVERGEHDGIRRYLNSTTDIVPQD